MSIITDLLTAVGTILTAFISLMSEAFQGVIGIFYEEETGFTMLGLLFVLGLAIGVFYFVFRFVRYLISLRSR